MTPPLMCSTFQFTVLGLILEHTSTRLTQIMCSAAKVETTKAYQRGSDNGDGGSEGGDGDDDDDGTNAALSSMR